MRRRPDIATAFLALALALAAPGHAQAQAQTAQKTGIVFMHGKQGNPGEPPLANFIVSLKSAGYFVDTPEMCWSGRRLYDKPYLDCLTEIDLAVARLKAAGATAIVIAGHSLGGNGALGYAARHDGIAAVIALAPGPENRYLDTQPVVAASLERARQMVAQGQGDVFADFTDYNTNRFGTGPIPVRTTATSFISFDAADGPAEMTANVPRVKAPMLIVSGTDDPSQRNSDMLFALAPPNPLSKHFIIDANHMGTPEAAIGIVLSWLAALPKP